MMRTIWVVVMVSAVAIGFGASPTTQATDPMPTFTPGSRILFQGDSITDMNRGRTADPNHILGHSYAFLIAARYGSLLPERHLIFINRGISGNKVSDLARRWKADTLDQKPTILSILIGVNDLNGNVSVEDYEREYDDLLAETTAALLNVRLVLCEPFGLPVGKHKDNWDSYHADLLARQAVVQKLGDKYHATVVHLQKVFDLCWRKFCRDTVLRTVRITLEKQINRLVKHPARSGGPCVADCKRVMNHQQ